MKKNRRPVARAAVSTLECQRSLARGLMKLQKLWRTPTVVELTAVAVLPAPLRTNTP